MVSQGSQSGIYGTPRLDRGTRSRGEDTYTSAWESTPGGERQLAKGKLSNKCFVPMDN